MPKVSILIPIYNDEKYIPNLIDSIICQTFKDFECLFYNHGSTDNSQKFLEEYVKKDDRLKVIEVAKNIGNGANNELLKYAKGEYIKFFCADDLMLPDCLEKMVSFFDKDINKKYSVLFGRSIEINDSGVELGRTNKKVVNKNRLEYLNYIFYRGNPEFCFPTIIIRKSAINCDDLFDERFGQINDVMLYLNFLLDGHEFYILDDNLIKYRKHDNNTSNLRKLNNKARFIFECLRLLEPYLQKIKSFDELLKIFPEAREFADKVEKNDTDLIPFIICQLALRVEKRVFLFLEFHKNFAMNQIFCMLSNKKLAKKIYNKFNFHYSDLKDLTLCNPNGMELAYFFNVLDLDYTQLKQKRGFFGLFYRIRKKVMKLKVGRISDLIKRFSGASNC